MEEIYSSKKEGLYTNNIKKMDPVGTADYAKIINRKKVNSENMRNTYTRSRSGI